MKSTRWYFVLTLASLLCAACGDRGPSGTDESSARVSPTKIEPIQFQEYLFPGTADNAKAGGFTECELDFNRYRCTRKGPTTLYGVPATDAFVELNSADAFTTGFYAEANVDVTGTAPAALSYRSVHLQFEREIDEACVKKHTRAQGEWGSLLDPEECIVTAGIQEVIDQLHANGWHGDSLGRVTRFYKDQEPVEITIQHTRLELSPLSHEAAMDKWTALREAQSRAEHAAEKANAFIDSMKTQ